MAPRIVYSARGTITGTTRADSNPRQSRLNVPGGSGGGRG